MVEEEILLKQAYLNMGKTFLLAIGLVIFFLVVRERKDLRTWLIAYFSLEVGFIFSNVSYLTGVETFNLISSVFYLLSAILICVAIGLSNRPDSPICFLEVDAICFCVSE